MSDLTKQHCVPCEGGTKPLTKTEAEKYLEAVLNWELLQDDKSIQRKFVFKDFKEAVDFTNKVAEIAESEGHHPDIFIHNYRKVDVTLSTHAIHGLSTNDFILAAKINQLENN